MTRPLSVPLSALTHKGVEVVLTKTTNRDEGGDTGDSLDGASITGEMATRKGKEIQKRKTLTKMILIKTMILKQKRETRTSPQSGAN